MAAFVIGRNDMYGYIFLVFNLQTLRVYDSFACKGFLNHFESIVNRMAKNILDTSNAHEYQNKSKVYTEELRETQVQQPSAAQADPMIGLGSPCRVPIHV